MTRKGSVIPALLLTAAVTALAAGFAVFWPGTEVAGTPHEQIAPEDQALVHIDFFTEKRDAPVEGVDILSSIRRYELAVYDAQAIRDRLLSGEPLALHIAGRPYTADLQEMLHDPEARSAGRHSFTGTLSGDGRAHLTVSGNVLRAYFEIGGVAYQVESTGRYDTVSPEKVLYYVFSSADVKGTERLLPHAVQHQQRGSKRFRIPCRLDKSRLPERWLRDRPASPMPILPTSPRVNETLRTGFMEVPLSENETVRIAKSYRGKIAEYCGNYYVIDFITA